ncbi:MAG: hypothetical protein R3E79_02400 [Caldilineaceae bacterium]
MATCCNHRWRWRSLAANNDADRFVLNIRKAGYGLGSRFMTAVTDGAEYDQALVVSVDPTATDF